MATQQDTEMDTLQKITEWDVCVQQSVESEGWGEDGESRITSKLNSILDAETPSSLLELHISLRSVFTSSLSLEPIRLALLSLSPHPHAQALQEAVVDVLETLQDEVVDGAAKSTATNGDEMVVDSNPGTSRYIGILQDLLDHNFLPQLLAASLLDPAYHTSIPISSLTAAKAVMLDKRKKTSLCYRQQKFNLLRESSEGFSYLLTLLSSSTSLGPGGDSEDPVSRRTRVKALWKQILLALGMFDLSPSRVLDLLLDAFCHNLTTHWRFFIDLLKQSPWGVRDVGGRKGKGRAREEMELDMNMEDARGWGGLEFAESLKREAGNGVLAQVLGFKFMAYHETPKEVHKGVKEVERVVEDTPMDLLYVAAILMREDLVRTVDILPYLAPDDSVLNNLAIRFRRDTISKIKSLGSNALALAGALTDDSAPASTSAAATAAAEAAAEEKRDLPEQKIMLCQALLGIGHLAPAFFILSRWPVIAQYRPAISDLLLRIVRYCLQPVAQRMIQDDLRSEKLDEGEGGDVGKVEKEVVLTTVAPLPFDTIDHKFRFFFSEWSAGLTQWESLEEVVDRVQPFARFFGPLGARDVSTLVRLVRIGVKHLKIDPSPQCQEAWVNLIRTVLLPSMPLLDANLTYNNELWPLLKPLHYTARYALYGEWQVAMTDQYDRATYSPTMALAAAVTQAKAKAALKRMTSNPDRTHARAVAKFSYSAPTALWATILNQIMSYQNMIPTVVESARYQSDIGWDVTMFMLLDALSDPTKDRVKDDGLHASEWLQAVTAFIGTLARRYNSVDLEPLLQQVANQLKAKSLADLITMRSLISKMSGIDLLDNVSETQVSYISGGRCLSAEAITVTRALQPEPPRGDIDKANWEKSGKQPEPVKASLIKSQQRLLNALISTNLAQPILVAIAQTQRACIYSPNVGVPPTKQLASIYDECGAHLIQFVRLLYSPLDTDSATGSQMSAVQSKLAQQCMAIFPTLKELQKDFGLSTTSAFRVLRPKLHYSLHNREQYLKWELKSKQQGLIKASAVSETDGVNWDENLWQPAFLPLIGDANRCLPPSAQKVQLAPFISTFWQLALSEIGVPEKTYTDTISRLRNVASDLESWSHPSSALNGTWIKAYSDNARSMRDLVRKLEEERAVQRTIVERSIARINSEIRHWFTGSDQPGIDAPVGEKRAFARALHQLCFYPRAISSTVDAVFVARFLRKMHDCNTENFYLILAFEQFFDDKLAPCVFACSETEASNLGVCLGQMLSMAETWRASEARYSQEAIGPCPNDPNKTLNGFRVNSKELLDWGRYKVLFKQWQRKLTVVITVCLAAQDYMHVNNGIAVCRALIPFFPKIASMRDLVKTALVNFKALENSRSDPRRDLLMAVQSYEHALEIAERNPTLKFVLPDSAFNAPTAGSRAAAASAAPKLPPSGPKGRIPTGPAAQAPVNGFGHRDRHAPVVASTPHRNAMEPAARPVVGSPAATVPQPPSRPTTPTIPSGLSGPQNAAAASNTAAHLVAMRDRLAKSKMEKAAKVESTPGVTPSSSMTSVGTNGSNPETEKAVVAAPHAPPTGPRNGSNRPGPIAAPTVAYSSTPAELAPKTADQPVADTAKPKEPPQELLPSMPRAFRFEGERNGRSSNPSSPKSTSTPASPRHEAAGHGRNGDMQPPAIPADTKDKVDARPRETGRAAEDRDARRSSRPPRESSRDRERTGRKLSPHAAPVSRSGSADSRTSRTSKNDREKRDRESRGDPRPRGAVDERDDRRAKEKERERPSRTRGGEVVGQRPADAGWGDRRDRDAGDRDRKDNERDRSDRRDNGGADRERGPKESELDPHKRSRTDRPRDPMSSRYEKERERGGDRERERERERGGDRDRGHTDRERDAERPRARDADRTREREKERDRPTTGPRDYPSHPPRLPELSDRDPKPRPAEAEPRYKDRSEPSKPVNDSETSALELRSRTKEREPRRELPQPDAAAAAKEKEKNAKSEEERGRDAQIALLAAREAKFRQPASASPEPTSTRASARSRPGEPALGKSSLLARLGPGPAAEVAADANGANERPRRQSSRDGAGSSSKRDLLDGPLEPPRTSRAAANNLPKPPSENPSHTSLVNRLREPGVEPMRTQDEPPVAARQSARMSSPLPPQSITGLPARPLPGTGDRRGGRSGLGDVEMSPQASGWKRQALDEPAAESSRPSISLIRQNTNDAAPSTSQAPASLADSAPLGQGMLVAGQGPAKRQKIDRNAARERASRQTDTQGAFSRLSGTLFKK